MWCIRKLMRYILCKMHYIYNFILQYFNKYFLSLQVPRLKQL